MDIVEIGRVHLSIHWAAVECRPSRVVIEEQRDCSVIVKRGRGSAGNGGNANGEMR